MKNKEMLDIGENTYTYHVIISPKNGEELPTIIDFYDIDKGMVGSTLEVIGRYVKHPKKKVLYDIGSNIDIQISLKSEDTPFDYFDEERKIL